MQFINSSPCAKELESILEMQFAKHAGCDESSLIHFSFEEYLHEIE